MIVALSSLAHNFDNKIFKGTIEDPYGRTRSMYFEFKEGGQLITTLKMPGCKIERDTNGTWRLNADFVIINIPGDGQNVLSISYVQDDNGVIEPCLVLGGSYGEDVGFYLISEEQFKKETASTPKTTKKSTTRPKKKR